MSRTLVLAVLMLAGIPAVASAQGGEGRSAVRSGLHTERPGSAAPDALARGAAHLGVRLAGGARASARIEGVSPDSPAQFAGLLAGDQVVALDDQLLASAQELIDAVRARRVGDVVVLRVRRTLSLELDGSKRTGDGRLALGAYLNDDRDSLTVARLAPGHPAAAAGVLPADRIVAVDGAAVRRESELADRMRDVREPRAIELTVERDLRVRLGDAPRPAPQMRQAPTRPLAPQVADERVLLEQLRALREEIDALRVELERLRRELARSRAR